MFSVSVESWNALKKLVLKYIKKGRDCFILKYED